MAVSEGDHALRLGEAESVGVVAMFAKVILPLAIVAVLACWTVPDCYVTVGTFARRGLSSTAKTLRSLSGVRGSEY